MSLIMEVAGVLYQAKGMNIEEAKKLVQKAFENLQKAIVNEYWK